MLRYNSLLSEIPAGKPQRILAVLGTAQWCTHLSHFPLFRSIMIKLSHPGAAHGTKGEPPGLVAICYLQLYKFQLALQEREKCFQSRREYHQGSVQFPPSFFLFVLVIQSRVSFCPHLTCSYCCLDLALNFQCFSVLAVIGCTPASFDLGKLPIFSSSEFFFGFQIT